MVRFTATFLLGLALTFGLAQEGRAMCDGLEGATEVSTNCSGISFEGCCNDGKAYWCGGGNVLCMLDCPAEAVCGWLAEGPFFDCGGVDPVPSGTDINCPGMSCTPNCTGKACGNDGCGGSCGTCPVGQDCNAGVCQGDCLPACGGKQCGDDGCGGSCGTCPQGQSCSNFQCVAACIPACEGKECGPDGCGSVCGICQDAEQCEDGLCTSNACVPVCGTKECGPDGCGGVCGMCGLDTMCSAQGMCEDYSGPEDDAFQYDYFSEDDVNDPGFSIDITITPNGKEDGSKSGCASTGNPSTGAALLILALALALFLRKRSI